MNRKIKIIKTVELDEDIVIFVGKKIHEEKKICKDCPHLKFLPEVDAHYCFKHRGLVFPNDTCIEEGM